MTMKHDCRGGANCYRETKMIDFSSIEDCFDGAITPCDVDMFVGYIRQWRRGTRPSVADFLIGEFKVRDRAHLKKDGQMSGLSALAELPRVTVFYAWMSQPVDLKYIYAVAIFDGTAQTPPILSVDFETFRAMLKYWNDNGIFAVPPPF